tara:strand:+ start:33 stop:302 length:270 start_codon:yes stop_codon:yes gene_type:complete
MPGEQNNERFKRDVTQGSRLQYLTRMKHFYESQFDELSKKIGEETEYGVLVTEQLLIKIEERLTFFEKEEEALLKLYRKNVLSSEKVTA